MELEQLDVNTSFLHGTLDENIYTTQPEGSTYKGNKSKVYLLKRSLYGFKQPPKRWYLRFDEFMLKYGFTKSCYDNCVYFKWKNRHVGIFLLLYVDNMLIASINKREIKELKA